MAMELDNKSAAGQQNPAGPIFHVSPSPHVTDGALTTRRMMVDVLLGLIPLIVASVLVFQYHALFQLAICVVSAMVAEALFTAMRRKPFSLGDGSAVVTAVILALSLPVTAPWYVGAVGSFMAIGLGKIVFGGLGQNIFNPAMVGRAFVMIAFPSLMGASAYVVPSSAVDCLTQATPLTSLKMAAQSTPLWNLFIGNTNGSLGETSAVACLLGGIYLCLRRTASWEIPAGVIGAVAVIAGLINLSDPHASWTVLHHLFAGALLFGAFFIATDPVTSPLTPKGKFIFGAGVGALVMLLRLFSGYPEGVMFAVLIMNAVTPLINRWTIPVPIGGPVPVKT